MSTYGNELTYMLKNIVFIKISITRKLKVKMSRWAEILRTLKHKLKMKNLLKNYFSSNIGPVFKIHELLTISESENHTFLSKLYHYNNACQMRSLKVLYDKLKTLSLWSKSVVDAAYLKTVCKNHIL